MNRILNTIYIALLVVPTQLFAYMPVTTQAPTAPAVNCPPHMLTDGDRKNMLTALQSNIASLENSTGSTNQESLSTARFLYELYNRCDLVASPPLMSCTSGDRVHNGSPQCVHNLNIMFAPLAAPYVELPVQSVYSVPMEYNSRLGRHINIAATERQYGQSDRCILIIADSSRGQAYNLHPDYTFKIVGAGTYDASNNRETFPVHDVHGVFSMLSCPASPQSGCSDVAANLVFIGGARVCRQPPTQVQSDGRYKGSKSNSKSNSNHRKAGTAD